MNLQDIFIQLSVGEFSQMRIGKQETGEINEANYLNVVSHINLGLNALFSRFNLREGVTELALVPGKYNYSLNLEDLLKVEKITLDSGYTLNLNDDFDMLSVKTPTMNSLVVPKAIVDKDNKLPFELKTDKLLIDYRAKHPKIDATEGTFDPLTVEVDIPSSHLNALLYFVASRVHNPIGMVNEFHAGNSYAAKYEQECQRLELLGLSVDIGEYRDGFYRNGWV